MISALETASRIRGGLISARTVLAETIARIRAVDHDLNCFTSTTFERAAREATAIDGMRAAGMTLPPLAGVPYAVKNLFDIAGEVTIAGGKLNASNPPAAADARLITKMQDAGAVLVGALNMDEHAYGFTTENTHYGATRNPHALTRTCGGSSGGSAAAVAAGLVPLALGTDTNGSIRVPASFCGIFGLKPTYGRLSRRGAFPLASSLDHVGPFAASVADLAATYDVLQGADPDDPMCAQRGIESVGSSLHLASGVRIGILGGWFNDWADPSARRAVQLAASALHASSIVEWTSAEAARSAAFLITAAEGGALHRERLRTQYDDYEPLSRDRLVAGGLIPASWVIKAQQVRRHARTEALALFEHFDLLIAPATPVVAPVIGTETLHINGHSVSTRASLGMLTQPISCIGLPVCTVPLWPDIGESFASGMPLGVQLIGAPWREDICLAAAHALEQAGVAHVT